MLFDIRYWEYFWGAEKDEYCMRKIMKIVLGIVAVIGIPIIIDFCVFGNSFPSNIENQVWAGFLGSYLGGIATLVAVFITIADNNKKIEEQKISEKNKLEEQKKYAIRPYLDTRYIFFDDNSIVGINDRVFDIKEETVEKVRYRFTSTDKKFIKMRQPVVNYIYLNYIIRNIGAGSAVDMKVNINGFSEKISIAKDETVNMFMLICRGKEKAVSLDILLDYWDVEKRAHYNQKDGLVITVEGAEQTIVSKEHTLPIEMQNP